MKQNRFDSAEFRDAIEALFGLDVTERDDAERDDVLDGFSVRGDREILATFEAAAANIETFEREVRSVIKDHLTRTSNGRRRELDRSKFGKGSARRVIREGVPGVPAEIISVLNQARVVVEAARSDVLNSFDGNVETTTIDRLSAVIEWVEQFFAKADAKVESYDARYKAAEQEGRKTARAAAADERDRAHATARRTLRDMRTEQTYHIVERDTWGRLSLLLTDVVDALPGDEHYGEYVVSDYEDLGEDLYDAGDDSELGDETHPLDALLCV